MKRILFSVLVLLALAACSSTSKNVSIIETPANLVIANLQPVTFENSYESTLSSGYFTAGVDFPAGEYDIEAVKGNGIIFSSNAFEGGVHGTIGVDDDYKPKYSNIVLNDGAILYLNEVNVKIKSLKVYDSKLKAREQPNKMTVSLGEGKYKAGSDFPAGVYDVVAARGAGQVEHGKSGILDLGLGSVYLSTENHAMNKYSQPYYKNVTFNKNDIIKVSEGIEIYLIPSL